MIIMIPEEIQQMLEKYKRDAENYVVDERLVKIGNQIKLGLFYDSLREIDYRLSTLERKNNLYNIAELELDYSARSCDYPTIHNMLNNIYQRLATLEFSYKLRTIEFSLSEVISHASIIAYEKDIQKNTNSLVPIKNRIAHVEKKVWKNNLPVNQYKPTIPQQKSKKPIIDSKKFFDKERYLQLSELSKNEATARKEELIRKERKKLLKSKCNACNRIPDNFGRCGCT